MENLQLKALPKLVLNYDDYSKLILILAEPTDLEKVILGQDPFLYVNGQCITVSPGVHESKGCAYLLDGDTELFDGIIVVLKKLLDEKA